MIVWPAELPQRPNSSDYTAELPDGMEWAQTDTGPGKSRLGTWAAVRPVTWSFDTDVGGKARFERFIAEDIRRGARCFAIRNVEMDGLSLATADGAVITTAAGAALTISAWWIVRLAKQRPAYKHLGGPWWRITMSLEVMP